jgi:hypothetical protein
LFAVTLLQNNAAKVGAFMPVLSSRINNLSPSRNTRHDVATRLSVLREPLPEDYMIDEWIRQKNEQARKTKPVGPSSEESFPPRGEGYIENKNENKDNGNDAKAGVTGDDYLKLLVATNVVMVTALLVGALNSPPSAEPNLDAQQRRQAQLEIVAANERDAEQNSEISPTWVSGDLGFFF